MIEIGDMICLSILGTGNYKPVKYQFMEKTASETPYFMKCVKELFEPQKILVLMTKEAKEKHSEHLKNEINDFTVLDIPLGKNETEMWAIFETISKSIPTEAELIIDITHGFRTQPILIMSVLVYLQVTKNINVKHILYGAFEAMENEIAPIFDLKPFLDIINWSFAAKNYIETGNAREISHIISEIQKSAFIQNKEYKPRGLISLGKTLQDISDAIALIRPQNLLEKTKLLEKHIESASKDLVSSQGIKPLKQLLEKIKSNYQSYQINPDNLFESEGLIAQKSLVQHYLETDQYQRAVTLSREILVSIVCIKENFDPINNRKSGEDILNSFVVLNKAGKTIEDEYREIVNIWDSIGNIRNDINHAGMRKQPLNSDRLKKNIIENCKRVIKLLEELTKKLNKN